MKQLLFALAVCLLAGIASAQVPGKHVTPQNDFDEYGLGLGDRGEPLILTANGTVALRLDRDATNTGASVFIWANYGASVVSDTNLFGVDVQKMHTLIERGDTIYYYPAFASTTPPVVARKYTASGFTSGDQDTLNLGTPSSTTGAGNPTDGDRGTIGWAGGDTLVWLHVDENTPNGDSTYVHKANGAFKTFTSWTEKLKINNWNAGMYLYASGLVNVNYGFYIWDNNGAIGTGPNLYFVDTEGNWDTLTTTISGTDFTSKGYNWCRFQRGPDSLIGVVYQSTTVGPNGNGLWARFGYANSGVSGPPGGVNWKGSAVQLANSTVFDSSWAACASISYLRRDPDTIFVYWRQKDGANVDVMRAMSTDGGVTFGSPEVRVNSATSTDRYYQLYVARWTNVNDTCLWSVFTYSDSADEASEVGIIYTDTTRLAGGGGGGGGGGSTKTATGILMGHVDDSPAWLLPPDRFGGKSWCMRFRTREECAL